MLRSLFAGVMFLFLISSAGAADDPAAQTNSTPPAAANMQDPAVGDHWTYQVTDEISGKLTATRTVLITDLSKNDVTIRFDIVGNGRSGVIVYDRSWNILSDEAFRYTPNDGTGVRLPLAVNAEWKFTSNSQNSNTGVTFKRSGSAHVIGKETVTTKVGAFDTFIIESKFTERNNRTPSRFSEITQKTWYSPELDHWAKRSLIVRQGGHIIRNDTVELTDFGRKK